MTRLTEEMVIARSKQSDLTNIKKLNCWGSDLTDVSICKKMRGVEVLALSVNKISTLQPFENCLKLQELYLRKNNIQDVNEIGYLQNLPALKYLWLEENPCCEKAGPNYRATVLRALPNLKKLDNIEVTQEEVDEALRSNSGSRASKHEEETYDDTFEQAQHQRHPQPSQHYAQQQRRSSSPHKEPSPQTSPAKTEGSGNVSKSGSPSQQRSPGSDHDSPGYRDRTQIPPSMSTHSMKEYYHADRPSYPTHYRHSQTDLTEWDEHHQHNQYNSNSALHYSARRSAGTEREPGDRHQYRNGSARETNDWDEAARPRRPDGRYNNDSASTVSAAVINHYSSYHRRPVNRSSNLLSATLCLVKELDYPSLEVVEHAVRCRIDEMSAE